MTPIGYAVTALPRDNALGDTASCSNVADALDATPAMIADMIDIKIIFILYIIFGKKYTKLEPGKRF
jgi:hypothetical protein